MSLRRQWGFAHYFPSAARLGTRVRRFAGFLQRGKGFAPEGAPGTKKEWKRMFWTLFGTKHANSDGKTRVGLGYRYRLIPGCDRIPRSLGQETTVSGSRDHGLWVKRPRSLGQETAVSRAKDHGLLTRSPWIRIVVSAGPCSPELDFCAARVCVTGPA